MGTSEKTAHPPPRRYFLWLVSGDGGERAGRMTLHLLNSSPLPHSRPHTDTQLLPSSQQSFEVGTILHDSLFRDS